MIGKKSSDNQNQMNLDNIQFIIVYEKFTKPAAISLYNQLSDKFTCAVWNKKNFFAEEPRITNRNKIILLNEDLIKENLANPSLRAVEIVPGMDYKREGNRIGIIYNDKTSPKKLSDILKENWREYTVNVITPIILSPILPIVGGPIVGGVVSQITAWLLTLDQKKKIKFKLYMDAVDGMASSKLQEIING